MLCIGLSRKDEGWGKIFWCVLNSWEGAASNAANPIFTHL